MARGPLPPGVYLLEFAGDDDAFAAREAATAASAVRPLAAGLATARGVAGVERLAFTRRTGDLVGTTDADVDAARALLAAASVDRGGSVAVRARDVRGTTGVDTQRAERILGQELVERGFAVDLDDPDEVLLALFAADERRENDGAAPPASGGTCALGWLTAEPPREFAPAPTDRPFFQPGSMDPALARALANLAGARPGRTVLDPMCGTGGVLVEAGLVGADVIGSDAQAKMARGTRENCRAFLDGGFEVLRADATRVPLADDAVDGVVFDAPYGRQSAIRSDDLRSLVAGSLAEAHRLAPRAVVVADRDWRDPAREVGWAVESAFERRVHRSLTRHVLVLDRTRND